MSWLFFFINLLKEFVYEIVAMMLYHNTFMRLF